MGFRFSRRITLFPGVSLNLGKRGASVSVGPRGAKMTFGRRGVKSSVGIPGTGIRYETPCSGGSGSWGGGGNGVAKGFCAFAMICGLVAYLAFQFGKVDRSPECQMFMVVAGALATVCLFVALIVAACSSVGTSSCRANAAASGSASRWNMYLHEMAKASQAFFDFLEELNRSTRCQNILKKLAGMESMDQGRSSFAVTPRLGAIAYCDVRDCFRRLGYSPASLDSIEGMGYAMFMCLLISKGFDVNRFFDRRQSREFARLVGDLDHTVTCEINIEGHENESRFAVVFGKACGEHEWVQRYSTLLYRWASLIAKADGTVTPEESEALAAIMNMQEAAKPDGNVRVCGTDSSATSETKDEGREEYDDSGSNRKQDLKEAMRELDSLVGLAPVKAEVRKLANFIEIQKKREEAGLKNASVSCHCVFTGNPGTGKTTVARIVADVYRSLGILKKGQLVETDRSGLVGEYVGQTAVKTNKIIDSALDGVLFVDEAYSLVQGGEKDYGGEAISTLLKRMEDDRGRLIVILAGYTNEMKAFIDSNPGLQSRFSRHVEFPDYSADELAQIFLRSVEKNQYVCNQDVRNSISTIMELAVAKKDRNFGNARYVRNLFENAIQRQAVRLSTVAPLTTQMLTELTLHDLGFEYE